MQFITLISKFFLGNKALPKIIRYISGFLLAGIVALLAFSLVAILHGKIGSQASQMALLNINFLLAAVIVVFFIRYCLYLFIYRKKGFGKIKLNSRLAGIFCVLAFIPGTAVLCFSLLFINSGVETWFSSRVTRSFEHSLAVAQAYLEERRERLLTEGNNLAKDPIFSAPSFLIDTATLKSILRQEQQERNLAELSLYDESGKLVTYSGDLIPSITSEEILNAFASNIFEKKSVIFPEDTTNRITAIIKIPDNQGYLVLRRWVHPNVLYFLDSTKQAYQEYYQLKSERNQVKLLFSLFFIVFSISLLCGSVFFSIRLARRIVHPLERLISGTNKIAEGDFNTKLQVIDNDEIGELTDAFNFMVDEINTKQKELQARHKEIKEKQKTLSAILTGVSSGVMTINTDGILEIANKKVTETFHMDKGDNIRNFCPELFEIAEDYLEKNAKDSVEEQIKIHFEDSTKEFLVRVVGLVYEKNHIKTLLITFDDITALHSAQKLGAWSDVARRMAHEIKNPLTPIQLSAERIRRRFSKQISTDNELFSDLTQIIIRQVEDLRKLVNEFSDFARMPSPVFEDNNLADIIKEIALLQSNRSKININLDIKDNNLPVSCDTTQIKRVLTNLLENAVNAIEENNKNSSGTIDIVAKISQNGNIELKIMDDGLGISEDIDISSLFDPYITTRKKGTGLGLAIVKKTIEEHKGSVNMFRRKPKGTIVSIILPLNKG